ncbi:S24 family peptidase [Paracoccus cavernae]
MVDVHDVRASAGHGAIVEAEDVIDRISFPLGYLERVTKTHPRFLKVIGVKGESMDPTIKDDDVVMLDTSKTSLDYDGLFVLRFGDALHVKRVGRASDGDVMIISDNSAYPPSKMARTDIHVVGKVIWLGKKV